MGLPKLRVRLRRGAPLGEPGVSLRVAMGQAPPGQPEPAPASPSPAEPLAPPAPSPPVEALIRPTPEVDGASLPTVSEPPEEALTRPTPGSDGERDSPIHTEPLAPPVPAPPVETLSHAPPEPDGEPSLSREHRDEAPEGWSPLALVALTSAVTFVVTAALFALWLGRPQPAPSAADERRARLETQELRRELELEEERLAGLAQAVTEDDARVAASWTRLAVEARALAAEHDRSMTAGRDLGTRLDVLAARAAELAGESSSVPPTLRPEVRRLEAEARNYRTILDRVLGEIEAQHRIALDHAESADTRSHQRELLGAVVRVIHDEGRLADARRLVALLEGAGAEAHLFPTRLADPSPHKGRLYYRGPEDQGAARRIARLVETIEPIEPEPVGRANPFLSLWIVGLPPLPDPVDDELPVDDFDPRRTARTPLDGDPPTGEGFPDRDTFEP